MDASLEQYEMCLKSKTDHLFQFLVHVSVSYHLDNFTFRYKINSLSTASRRRKVTWKLIILVNLLVFTVTLIKTIAFFVLSERQKCSLITDD